MSPDFDIRNNQRSVIEERNYVFESQNHEINNSEDELEKCTSLLIKQKGIFNKVFTALDDDDLDHKLYEIEYHVHNSCYLDWYSSKIIERRKNC